VEREAGAARVVAARGVDEQQVGERGVGADGGRVARPSRRAWSPGANGAATAAERTALATAAPPTRTTAAAWPRSPGAPAPVPPRSKTTAQPPARAAGSKRHGGGASRAIASCSRTRSAAFAGQGIGEST
jgi:hypothetical protein